MAKQPKKSDDLDDTTGSTESAEVDQREPSPEPAPVEPEKKKAPKVADAPPAPYPSQADLDAMRTGGRRDVSAEAPLSYKTR